MKACQLTRALGDTLNNMVAATPCTPMTGIGILLTRCSYRGVYGVFLVLDETFYDCAHPETCHEKWPMIRESKKN